MYRIIIFIILNFSALAIGGLFTSEGVSSEWYVQAAKAPWTPPGWVFGAAWSFIMITFAFYMSILWGKSSNKKWVVGLFVLQWFLNVSWNPLFFYLHEVGFALIVIILLTVLMCFFFFQFWNRLKLASLLVLPYCVWLIIASSLNAYSFLYN